MLTLRWFSRERLTCLGSHAGDLLSGLLATGTAWAAPARAEGSIGTNFRARSAHRISRQGHER